MFVNVIINAKVKALEKPYLYKANGFNLEVGDLVLVEFGQGNRQEKAFVVETYEENPTDLSLNKIKNVKKLLEKDLFNEEDLKTVEFLKENYLCSNLDAIKLFLPKGDLDNLNHKKRQVLKTVTPPLKNNNWLNIYNVIKDHEEKKGLIKSEATSMGLSLSSINTMIKHGYLEVVSINDMRFDKKNYDSYEKKVLNEEQKNALDIILNSRERCFLLHGVTGSGKTEVFLNIVEDTLNKGEDSIILVPEISLTPQLIERVKGRFGNNISIYHSKLNDGERYDEWKRVKDGKCHIAIGARSALFLPFKNLTTIIIDEEHEMSYKSDTNPKYLTNEVARFLAYKNNGKVVMCSATPSLESYYLSQIGLYKLVEMKNRVLNVSMPEVEVVDLREELRNGNKSVISNKLDEEINKALKKKEQVILFLNRRGYSSHVSCRSCGYVYRCPHCSVSLVKHNGNRLTCHHCGYSTYQKKTCPSCNSKLVKEFGSGTQMVEEQIKGLYKDAKILRMDKDTTRLKNSYEEIYRKFKNGEADILIGTQMIAKGLDFENVTLVGILAADTALNIPDFRAYERAFQLITQVSGRSGRKISGGKVILQTYEPYNYPITTSSKNDYKGFYEKEMPLRKIFSYPPFGKMTSIVISSKDEGKLIEVFKVLTNKISNILKDYDNITILGPTECLIKKLKDYFRYQLVIKGNIELGDLKKIKETIYEETKNKDYKISIDLNPSQLI